MFAKRLRELRLELGLTQKELGIKLGFKDNAITNYEKDNREPDRVTLCKLADIFNVTTDYLLGRTDNRQAIILQGNSLPPELHGVIDSIEIIKDAMNSGLSQDDIKEILAVYKKIKNK